MEARTTTQLPSNELTPKECALLDILSTTGAENDEIATIMIISPNTVRTHLVNISNKLEINGRVRLVLYWLANRPPTPNNPLTTGETRP